MGSTSTDVGAGEPAPVPAVDPDRLPVQLVQRRELFDRAHSYGAAHEAERLRAGFAPAPRAPRARTRALRPLRGPLAVLRERWAGSDRRPVDVWRRLRCRAGRHEFRGGEQIQLGNRFVYIERRCAWCDAEPPL